MILAAASPTEALRRVNALEDHQGSTPQSEPWLVSVSPGDCSCTLTFCGHDERNTRLYYVVAQPAQPELPEVRAPLQQRTTISVDVPERERTVTVPDLDNFVEYILTITAVSNRNGEATVACLATPLPSVPARPTIHGVRTSSRAIDINPKVHRRFPAHRRRGAGDEHS
jgi:hypothetical protein